jgi:hypothetical protein
VLPTYDESVAALACVWHMCVQEKDDVSSLARAFQAFKSTTAK